MLYRSGPDGGARKLLTQLPIDAKTFSYTYTDNSVTRGKLYIYDVVICTQGTGCQGFGEPQPVFFRPKGGNIGSIGGFTTTQHTNYNDKKRFPYLSSLMYFDMGHSVGGGNYLEVYRRGLFEQPKLIARLDSTLTKWQWQDKTAAPGNEYVYEFKVCDERVGACHWSEMQTYVNFYPEPHISSTHNYLPNYVQVQFRCDGFVPNAYYLVTKSSSKNGGVMKSWRIDAPNVPNGDCRLPAEDIDVKLDGLYYYSIYFISPQGGKTIVKENIEVSY